MVDKCGEHPLKGPNDLVFDRHGGLWFTDLGKRRARDMDVGAFYYIKPGMKEIVEGAVRHAAGQRHRPVAGREHRLCRGDADGAAVGVRISAPGEVKPRDVIYRGERGKPIAGLGGYQMFDSLAVEASRQCLRRDADLGLHFGDRARWHLVEQVPTGDRVTTNIAFGGPELKTAYITLSGKGELIAMDWARPGLPLNFLNK